MPTSFLGPCISHPLQEVQEVFCLSSPPSPQPTTTPLAGDTVMMAVVLLCLAVLAIGLAAARVVCQARSSSRQEKVGTGGWIQGAGGRNQGAGAKDVGPSTGGNNIVRAGAGG